MGHTTVCFLLVSSFLQDIRLEQWLHIYVSPADKCYPCCATVTCRDSTSLVQAGTCPGCNMKYSKKKAFLKKGAQTLAQIAWRACGVSIIQDTQNPTGHAPKKPAVTVCALSRDWARYSPEMSSCLNCSVFCILELQSLICTALCSCKINTNVWGHQSISLHSGIVIPHLYCSMLIQNKYQCLRTPKYFSAFRGYR